MRLKTPPNDEDPPIKREVALEVAMQMSHEKVRTVAEFVTGEQIEVERSMVVEGDTSRVCWCRTLYPSFTAFSLHL